MARVLSKNKVPLENKWRGFSSWIYDPADRVDYIINYLEGVLNNLKEIGLNKFCRNKISRDYLGMRICFLYEMARLSIDNMKREALKLKKSIENIKEHIDEYLWRLNAEALLGDPEYSEYLKSELAVKLHAAVHGIMNKYNEERNLGKLNDIMINEVKDKLSPICKDMKIWAGLEEVTPWIHEKKYIDIKCGQAHFEVIIEIHFEEKRRRRKKQDPLITDIDYEIIPRNPEQP